MVVVVTMVTREGAEAVEAVGCEERSDVIQLFQTTQELLLLHFSVVFHVSANIGPVKGQHVYLNPLICSGVRPS